MGFLRTSVLCLLALCTAVAGPTSAVSVAAVPPTETEIRGAFLLNFAGFVTWPEEGVGGSDAETVIGVLGDEELHGVLAYAIEARRPRSSGISLALIDSLEQVKSCHILYVGDATSISAREVLSVVGDHPVLTVSMRRGFADQGGIIGLFSEQGRMRFDINRRSERRARLQISSRLLRLARKILE